MLDELAAIDRGCIPSYFDIAAALASAGPCYTFPSPTLFALEAALQDYATERQAQLSYDRYAELGVFVRQQLREHGPAPLAEEKWACPVVTTFTPPGEDSSPEFVDRCRGWGFAIGGQSAYLAERRLVQIATMGAVTRNMVSPLFKRVGRWLAKSPALELATSGSRINNLHNNARLSPHKPEAHSEGKRRPSLALSGLCPKSKSIRLFLCRPLEC